MTFRPSTLTLPEPAVATVVFWPRPGNGWTVVRLTRQALPTRPLVKVELMVLGEESWVWSRGEMVVRYDALVRFYRSVRFDVLLVRFTGSTPWFDSLLRYTGSVH